MIRTLIVSIILLLAPAAARAETRVALLIGEGDYYKPPPPAHGDFWPKLANPPHDVGLVAQKLKQDGFDVTLAVDLGRADLEKAIAAFALKASKADDAVVYYAGHGFEYGRHNYLVPVDASTTGDINHLGETFIDFDEVAKAAGKAHHVNIFFLDACRTSDQLVKLTGPTKPYVDDIEFKPGTPVAVVYSTARGEQAFDRGITAPPPLDYSPFAWFVAEYVTLPRTSLGDFFTFVNAKVQDSTRTLGPQSPYMLSSLTEIYYFHPAGALSPRPPATPASGQASPVQSGKPAGRGGPALNLPISYLAVTDEPVVVADVLADHSADDLAAMAEGGDPMAAYVLGYMFEFGSGVQRDQVQARIWLEQAAASKLAPTQLELGYFLLRHGIGDADKAQARALMEAAAAQGFAKAQAWLADVLMNDKVYADYYRGLDLYRAAAKQNYPQALYALATLKQPDDPKGKLTALAAKGDMSSRQWLCELAAGDGSIAGDLTDCTAAAEAGYAISQARLAITYHDGAGVAADADQARHWTRLALQQPDLSKDMRTRLKSFGY